MFNVCMCACMCVFVCAIARCSLKVGGEARGEPAKMAQDSAKTSHLPKGHCRFLDFELGMLLFLKP